MDNNKISLAIFGNQNSNSGFQPLYWINDPPQQLENIVPPGMDENPYFFTLQVLPAHTQYTLIHNRVSSYMSVRPGVLKMAITIPKGYSIRDGVSPLEVLLDVRQQFIDTCMTLRNAHTEAYNYKEKLANPDIFVNIIDSYQLVPNAQPHLPMTGTEDAVMLIDDMAISQLFIAPQYPEFQKFRSIVIANKGNASVYEAQFNGVLAPAPAKDLQKIKSETSPSNLDAPKNKISENQSASEREKSDKQRKKLLIILGTLIVVGIAVFLLMPSSGKKVKKQNTTEVVSNEVEEEPEEEDVNGNNMLTDPMKEKQEMEEVQKMQEMHDKKEMEDSKQPVNNPGTAASEDKPVVTNPPTNTTRENPVTPHHDNPGASNSTGKNNGKTSENDGGTTTGDVR